jgi:hypothetical protein
MIQTRSQRMAGIRSALFAALYVFTLVMPASVAASDPTQPEPSLAAGALVEPNPSAGPTADPSPAATPGVDSSPIPGDGSAVPSPAPEASSVPEPSPAPDASPLPEPGPAPDASPLPEPGPAPDASPTPAPATPGPSQPVRYIVTFRGATSAAEQSAALGAVGAVEVSSIPELRMSIVELDGSSASGDVVVLAGDPAVNSVEPDLSREVEAAGDPRLADQWSLPRIGWDALHAQGLPTGSATVAILDTGVDANQPDLQGRLLPGQSFVDGSPANTDPHGHGTWMAGIVAAATDNGTGIAGIGGDGVRVLPITVLGADGTGLDSAVIAGIVAAVDGGADVILMAFSNPGYSPALQAAIDYAWADDGVLVAASGNDGVSTPTYPAGDRGVMGIASTDQADQLAADSNHGPQTFLAAPGVDILTTAAGADSDPQTDDEYRSVSGTSAAAAEVAGAAAVLRALDAGASNAVIVGRLARSAAPAGTQDETGNGRLDLAQAAADTGADSVQPAGAGGGGGPFVGPYVAASGTTDCYRTVASGDWSATGTWESAPTAGGCTVWTAATLTPTSTASTITIRNGHTATVTANVTVDQVTVDVGGQLTVNTTKTLTLNNGTGDDLTVNGTLTVSGTVAMGSSVSTNVTSSGTTTVNSGGLITGAGGNGSTRSVLTISSTSTSTIAGGITGGLYQIDLAGLVSISGNISVTTNSVITITGNVSVTSAGSINMGGSTGSACNINSGGIVDYASGSTNTVTGGSSGVNGTTVASGGTLKLRGTSVITSTTGGPVTVASGGNLEIGSTAGIAASGATGNIQVAGARTFNTGGNYSYIGTAAQITGTALPATVNNLTINNSGGDVTLTNAATTVSGALTLTSGDLSTGTGANVLTLAAAATCNGTTDVISGSAATGGVSRTTIGVGTTRCFGNPNNQITINSGTAPTAFTVKLVKSVPAAKSDAITRTYSITPTGGSGFAATVRLHYLDVELNGNTEGALHLWRLNGSWTDQDPTGASTTRDTTADWVQQTSIGTFSDWTLAQSANVAPVVTATVANLAYTENATVALDSGITVTDVDSANLASATVTMTTNYVNGQDTLAFSTQNGITGTWTASTGVLALSGSSTVANYQTALRSITYTNTSDDPNTATRTVTFIANDGTGNSNTASRGITITAVNDVPVVTATVANLAYTENATVALDSGITVTDVDSANLASATVTMTTNYVNGQDTLAFSTQNGITGTWTASTGVLALSGSSTVANYQTALRSITYTNTSDDPNTATRTVTFIANDGTGNSNTASRGITITAVNDVPSFTKGSDQSVLEDAAAQSISGWATAISPGPSESSQVVDFIVSNDNNALFSVQPAVSATGTLTYTLTSNANGLATVSVQIHDNGGTANGGVDTSATQTFSITVTAVNDVPSFTKGSDQSVLEDAAAQVISSWATASSRGAANESSQAVDFIVTNDNNALFSVQPAVALDCGLPPCTTGTLTYTLTSNANGLATVSVQIHDNGGTANGGVDTSATQTFSITVTAVNDVPSFTKGSDQSVLEDAGAQSVSGWATAISAGPADESGQVLGFFVFTDNPSLFGGQPNVSPSGTLSYTPWANASGSATVYLWIYDNGGTANGGVDTSATQTFTIAVKAVNDVPSFTKGADQVVRQEAAAQSVSGWATAISAGPADESSQVVDFIVTNDFNGLFSAQPAISATGTLSYTPAPGMAGVATVTVQVHDDGGTADGGVDTSAAQTFVITVDDGAYTSSSGWSTSFDSSRYLKLTFPAYVPAGSVITSATFRHEYRSATAGDTTCYYFEVYSGATLLATHGSAGSPVSCNATTSYASDAVALPEVDTVAEANTVTIKLFVRNSGGRASQHRIATLGITSSLD